MPTCHKAEQNELATQTAVSVLGRQAAYVGHTSHADTQHCYYIILAEAARLRRASTAMRTVNDIPTSCVRCCIVAVLKTEVRILSP